MLESDDYQLLEDRYIKLRESDPMRVSPEGQGVLPPAWKLFEKEHRAPRSGNTSRFMGMRLPEDSDGLTGELAEFLADEFRKLGIECTVNHDPDPSEAPHSGVFVLSKGDCVLELHVPWQEEPTRFILGRCFDRWMDELGIAACLLFLEGADSFERMAEDARWSHDGWHPDRVVAAIEQGLDLCVVRNPSDDLEPLEHPVGNSRERLDEALAALAKTKSDFVPSDIMAMCYAPTMSRFTPGKRELTCECCGAHFKVLNAFGQLKLDYYETYIDAFRDMGYDARIDVVCPECAMRMGMASSYELVMRHSDGGEVRTPLCSDLASREDDSCIDCASLDAVGAFLKGADSYGEIDEASSNGNYGASRFQDAGEYEAELMRILGLGER